jgi:hypothetical protein
VKGLLLENNNNQAAWHYLQGNFELALEMFLEEEEGGGSGGGPLLKAAVEERAALILSSHLKRNDMRGQLGKILERDDADFPSSSLLQLKLKEDVKVLDTDELSLWELLSLGNAFQ